MPIISLPQTTEVDELWRMPLGIDTVMPYYVNVTRLLNFQGKCRTPYAIYGYWHKMCILYSRKHSILNRRFVNRQWIVSQYLLNWSQIARFMGPTWRPPGSCRPQVGPMLATWTLLSGMTFLYTIVSTRPVLLILILLILMKFYVGLYKSYVGDKKSYVGDKKSYVGDKKSYVGLIFLHICCGPRKLP